MSNGRPSRGNGAVKWEQRMDPTSARGVAKYMSLAFLLPISTFVGYGMGYGLDLLCGTRWIRYVFLGLGMVSGFISLIRELDEDARQSAKRK